MGGKSIRTRRDRNYGATHRLAPEQGPDPKLQNEDRTHLGLEKGTPDGRIRDVSNILREQSLHMAFIQSNNVIQMVLSAASHPPVSGELLFRL